MSRRDELEFKPAALEVLETPPHPLARGLTVLFMLFIIIALAWAIVGRIDVVAVAHGKIVPSQRVNVIQPLENGTITAIHVQDGQHVTRGDVLVALDPTEQKTAVRALKADLAKALLDEAAAAAMLEPDPLTAFRTPAGLKGRHDLLVAAAKAQLAGSVEELRAALAEVDAELAEQRAALADAQSRLTRTERVKPLVNELHDGMKMLAGKGLVRKPDWFDAQRRKIDNESEIITGQSAITQVKSRIEARNKRREEIIAKARANALKQRAEALKDIAKLKEHIARETQRMANRTLRAPVDGTVFGLTVHTVGGVVTTKDVLLQIVPEAAELEAEVSILNKDIGFIKPGQDVEIKVDTFAFTRYGLIPGTVTSVWRDAVADESQGLVYRAEIALHETRLRVGDKWEHLVPGMSIQAEVKTGKRRAISFFLSPFLRYRDESLRER